MTRKKASDQDQIGALRQQVDSLSQRSAVLAGNAGHKASEAAATGARVVQEQTEALAGVVRRQPLVALLVGIGFGYFLGRLISSIRWRQSPPLDDRPAGARNAPDRRSGAMRRLAELASVYVMRR